MPGRSVCRIKLDRSDEFPIAIPVHRAQPRVDEHWGATIDHTNMMPLHGGRHALLTRTSDTLMPRVARVRPREGSDPSGAETFARASMRTWVHWRWPYVPVLPRRVGRWYRTPTVGITLSGGRVAENVRRGLDLHGGSLLAAALW